MNNKDGFNVTPWDVTGEVNYKKLIAKFGTKEITQNLLRDRFDLKFKSINEFKYSGLKKMKKNTHSLNLLFKNKN